VNEQTVPCARDFGLRPLFSKTDKIQTSTGSRPLEGKLNAMSLSEGQV